MQTNETRARQIAMTIKSEIRSREDLSSCDNFEQLHDFCDANTLGEQETFAENYDDWDEAMGIIGRAQEIVNNWLIDLSALRAAQEVSE